jgi:hypothetical protein
MRGSIARPFELYETWALVVLEDFAGPGGATVDIGTVTSPTLIAGGLNPAAWTGSPAVVAGYFSGPGSYFHGPGPAEPFILTVSGAILTSGIVELVLESFEP